MDITTIFKNYLAHAKELGATKEEIKSAMHCSNADCGNSCSRCVTVLRRKRCVMKFTHLFIWLFY